jgi:enamine deaminase RidA (YjgF/YER057c/UK114 family)
MANGFNPAGSWGPRGRGSSMGVVQHPGHVVHLTGQVAFDENEAIVGPGDVGAQTHQCIRNIATVLAEVGGLLDDVVSVTTYFTDRSQLPIIQEVRSRYFGADTAPASTSVMVAGLGHPDFLVELTAIAAIPAERFKPPPRPASAPSAGATAPAPASAAPTAPRERSRRP